jgi:hypothetical protein
VYSIYKQGCILLVGPQQQINKEIRPFSESKEDNNFLINADKNAKPLESGLFLACRILTLCEKLQDSIGVGSSNNQS